MGNLTSVSVNVVIERQPLTEHIRNLTSVGVNDVVERHIQDRTHTQFAQKYICTLKYSLVKIET